MFKIEELIKVTGAKPLSIKFGGLVRGVSIDSRTIKSGELFIAIRGARFDGHDFIESAFKKGAAAVIVDRVSRDKINFFKDKTVMQVKNSIKALTDIAGYHRQKRDIPVIAITGSNGKTTTKDMIAWVLSAKFKVLKNPGTQNNQIGLPMALLNLKESFDAAVLEMGTNHFGEIGQLAKIARPNIGVVTNIGPAHLEFLKTLEGVYREKITLIDNLTYPSIAVVNMDDSLLKRSGLITDRFVVGFAINNHADYKAKNISKKGKESIRFTVNSKCQIRLKTFAACNVYNALAAISVARILGLDYNTVSARLSNFEFPKSRFTPVCIDKINFIDDTYNSNPASLNLALDALDELKITGRKVFIMGDMLELGKKKESLHRLAGKKIAKICNALITVGNLARLTSQAAIDYGLNAKSIFNCDSSEEARIILYEQLKPNKNDVVLVKGSRLMRMESIIR